MHRPPQLQVPWPLQVVLLTEVGHVAVEHWQVGPDQPLAHEHWPVAQSHEPPLAHAVAQPWHGTHSAAPFTTPP